MSEDPLPILMRVRYWTIGGLILGAGWMLRMAGLLSDDEITRKQIEQALLGMWDAGMWVRKIDGSRFRVH